MNLKNKLFLLSFSSASL